MRELTFEQDSWEWHQARSGIVTGTSLGRAVDTKKKQETLLYELVSERMTETEIIELNTDAVVRGRELEPVAIKIASKELGYKFEKTGMLMSDEIKGFGISPDAIFRENEKVVGGIEVKCPNSKKHVEYIFKNEIPKEYFHQSIAPFVVSDDIQWYYFMSFDDRNYERPCFYHKIMREDFSDEIESMKIRLRSFLETVYNAHLKLTF